MISGDAGTAVVAPTVPAAAHHLWRAEHNLTEPDVVVAEAASPWELRSYRTGCPATTSQGIDAAPSAGLHKSYMLLREVIMPLMALRFCLHLFINDVKTALGIACLEICAYHCVAQMTNASQNK
jgi:hypothetical protein